MNGIVIFDLDNTIVHSTIDFAAIRGDIIALWREHNITNLSDEEFQHLSIGQIIELAASHDEYSHNALMPIAWQIVLEYERAGMHEATIEDGAYEELTVLRRDGFRLAVLTNNARQATLEALDKFGLQNSFDLILTRDEVAMKPDPAGICCARAHFGDCSMRAAMVGDSWLDGAAAQRAGVPFITFRPKPGRLEARGIPVWAVVDRLSEITAVLAGPWPDS
jgi:phosphoglycolate phosphatase